MPKEEKPSGKPDKEPEIKVEPEKKEIPVIVYKVDVFNKGKKKK